MVFFQRDLLGRVLQWLTDSAAIIRGEAAAALCSVAEAFGQQWTQDHVLDRVRLTLTLCAARLPLPVLGRLAAGLHAGSVHRVRVAFR